MSSTSDKDSARDERADTPTCPNCRDPRPGAFCARCGQNERDYMRSVWPVVGDFFRDTFEIDSRIFRTLKLLFFKPGQLSIEFSRNRRARYLSPVRLFLFVTLVHLGVVSLAISNDWYSWSLSGAVDPSSFPEPTQSQIETVRAKLEPEDRTRLDEILGREPEDMTRGTLATYIVLDALDDGGLSPSVFRVLIGIYHNPEAMIDRVMRRASLVIILSLPLYALALAVVYFDKRRFFVEHVVLATHLLTLSLAALLIYMIPPRGFLGIGLWLVGSGGHLGYYLAALRRYFGESWGRTVARFLALGMLWGVVSLVGTIVAWYLG